jgi:hypothetical protein
VSEVVKSGDTMIENIVLVMENITSSTKFFWKGNTSLKFQNKVLEIYYIQDVILKKLDF